MHRRRIAVMRVLRFVPVRRRIRCDDVHHNIHRLSAHCPTATFLVMVDEASAACQSGEHLSILLEQIVGQDATSSSPNLNPVVMPHRHHWLDPEIRPPPGSELGFR